LLCNRKHSGISGSVTAKPDTLQTVRDTSKEDFANPGVEKAETVATPTKTV